MKAMRLITIDGPSASGKSSVSREVAKALGWDWVSTGAFYRGLALAAIRKDCTESPASELVKLANDPVWAVKMNPMDTEVYFEGKNLTEDIAGERVGAVASRLSLIPEVRQALLQRQRDCYREEKGLVAEGRDCGTVVFPQASAKIYLTASPTLRAKRRSQDEQSDLGETSQLIKDRDAQDRSRKVSPLKVADGALTIDSSHLSLEEVVIEVIAYARRCGVQ